MGLFNKVATAITGHKVLVIFIALGALLGIDWGYERFEYGASAAKTMAEAKALCRESIGANASRRISIQEEHRHLFEKFASPALDRLLQNKCPSYRSQDFEEYSCSCGGPASLLIERRITVRFSNTEKSEEGKRRVTFVQSSARK